MSPKNLRRYLLYTAIIVILISAYELSTRIDAMWAPLKMFWNMAVGEKIPLSRAIKYVDWSILKVPLYLLAGIVLGLCALWARRTVRGCALMILPSLALCVLGFMLPLTTLGGWVQPVRMLPMLLLCVLSFLGVIVSLAHRPHKPEDPPRPRTEELPPPPKALPEPRRTAPSEERPRVRRRYRNR